MGINKVIFTSEETEWEIFKNVIQNLGRNLYEELMAVRKQRKIKNNENYQRCKMQILLLPNENFGSLKVDISSL